MRQATPAHVAVGGLAAGLLTSTARPAVTVAVAIALGAAVHYLRLRLAVMAVAMVFLGAVVGEARLRAIEAPVARVRPTEAQNLRLHLLSVPRPEPLRRIRGGGRGVRPAPRHPAADAHRSLDTPAVRPRRRRRDRRRWAGQAARARWLGLRRSAPPCRHSRRAPARPGARDRPPPRRHSRRARCHAQAGAGRRRGRSSSARGRPRSRHGARPGRGDRRDHPPGLARLRPQPPPGGERPERDAPGGTGYAAARADAHRPAGTRNSPPLSDCSVRTACRRRPVAAACGRDGRGRDRRDDAVPARVALVRAPPGRNRNPRAEPPRERRPRLAALLRRGRRNPGDRPPARRRTRASGRGARHSTAGPRPCPRFRRGRRDHACSHSCDRSARGVPLRCCAACRTARKPSRSARGRPRDVARDGQGRPGHRRRSRSSGAGGRGAARPADQDPARLPRGPRRALRRSSRAAGWRCRCIPRGTSPPPTCSSSPPSSASGWPRDAGGVPPSGRATPSGPPPGGAPRVPFASRCSSSS